MPRLAPPVFSFRSFRLALMRSLLVGVLLALIGLALRDRHPLAPLLGLFGLAAFLPTLVELGFLRRDKGEAFAAVFLAWIAAAVSLILVALQLTYLQTVQQGQGFVEAQQVVHQEVLRLLSEPTGAQQLMLVSLPFPFAYLAALRQPGKRALQAMLVAPPVVLAPLFVAGHSPETGVGTEVGGFMLMTLLLLVASMVAAGVLMLPCAVIDTIDRTLWPPPEEASEGEPEE